MPKKRAGGVGPNELERARRRLEDAHQEYAKLWLSTADGGVRVTSELRTARKAYKAGNRAGLYTALSLWAKYESKLLGLPAWARDATLMTLWWGYLKSPEGKRWLRTWKKDQEHYERWEMVMYIRDKKEVTMENVRHLQRTAGGTSDRELEAFWEKELALQKKRAKQLVHTDATETGVYATAAEFLKKHGAEVAPSTVRASHGKVQRDRERETPSFRFYGGRLGQLRWRLKEDARRLKE